ncbi:hypothetical protein OV203_04640 [Nannocystis sp. ILAH1]|uniref:hypothetical protein n=1 Tax=unclassified Nannocystis TaxID=2627009 RepID=UPI0022710AB4|nr:MULTISPECIES: hypothetical protein [unclassified Nannocystis]MCY0986404.1 hypothetical protein [Nannocystis sp. ILAH1]MCY1067192.1 hypothetical protein [Nannocystis sp. RBIL2]
MTLESLDERFEDIRFSASCTELKLFAQEVLAVGDAERHQHAEPYFELLSNTAKSLFLASCGGTLSTEEKRRIFTLIREDWTDDAPEGIRASMLALLGLIQPLEGVPEWLLSLAERQRDPTYAEVLRGCATCPRTAPAV